MTFGARPILIGERINPTGKPRLKQALREGDLEYLCREGIAQTEHGADILDVNVGLPELDEPAVMEKGHHQLAERDEHAFADRYLERGGHGARAAYL